MATCLPVARIDMLPISLLRIGGLKEGASKRRRPANQRAFLVSHSFRGSGSGDHLGVRSAGCGPRLGSDSVASPESVAELFGVTTYDHRRPQ